MTGVTIWPADVAKAPATVPDAEKDPEPPSDSSYSSDSEDEGYSGDAEESDGQPIDAERNTILTEFCGISVGRPGDSARKRPRIRDDIPIASDTRTKVCTEFFRHLTYIAGYPAVGVPSHNWQKRVGRRNGCHRYRGGV